MLGYVGMVPFCAETPRHWWYVQEMCEVITPRFLVESSWILSSTWRGHRSSVLLPMLPLHTFTLVVLVGNWIYFDLFCAGVIICRLLSGNSSKLCLSETFRWSDLIRLVGQDAIVARWRFILGSIIFALKCNKLLPFRELYNISALLKVLFFFPKGGDMWSFPKKRVIGQHQSNTIPWPSYIINPKYLFTKYITGKRDNPLKIYIINPHLRMLQGKSDPGVWKRWVPKPESFHPWTWSLAEKVRKLWE